MQLTFRGRRCPRLGLGGQLVWGRSGRGAVTGRHRASRHDRPPQSAPPAAGHERRDAESTAAVDSGTGSSRGSRSRSAVVLCPPRLKTGGAAAPDWPLETLVQIGADYTAIGHDETPTGLATRRLRLAHCARERTGGQDDH